MPAVRPRFFQPSGRASLRLETKFAQAQLDEALSTHNASKPPQLVEKLELLSLVHVTPSVPVCAEDQSELLKSGSQGKEFIHILLCLHTPSRGMVEKRSGHQCGDYGHDHKDSEKRL